MTTDILSLMSNLDEENATPVYGQARDTLIFPYKSFHSFFHSDQVSEALKSGEVLVTCLTPDNELADIKSYKDLMKLLGTAAARYGAEHLTVSVLVPRTFDRTPSSSHNLADLFLPTEEEGLFLFFRLEDTLYKMTCKNVTLGQGPN